MNEDTQERRQKDSNENLAEKHLELFRRKYYEDQRIKAEKNENSRFKRILALIYISCIGFFSMVCYDLPGSLESQIEKTFAVETYEFEYLYSVTCFPNIILAYFDGILIDRVLGVKMASFLVAGIVLLGQVILTVGGFVRKFWVLILARFIYGLGCDSLLVISNYYSVLWFSGKGLNFVFGVVMSTARLGTSFVFLIASPIYRSVRGLKEDHDITVGSTFSISVVSGILVFLSVAVLAWLSEKNGKLDCTRVESAQHDKKSVFNFRQLFSYPFKFWLVTIIFLSLQTAVLAFVTCSQQLLVKKYHVHISTANKLGSIFNLILSVSAPIAGIIIDKFGKNLYIIIASLVVAILSQILIAFVICSPYIPLILFGVSCGTLFSCVLPLTALVVPPSQLGAAFGLSVSLSDLCLTVFNIVAGYFLYKYGYLATALFYAALLACGLVSSVILFICDRRDGGTLNNILVDKSDDLR